MLLLCVSVKLNKILPTVFPYHRHCFYFLTVSQSSSKKISLAVNEKNADEAATYFTLAENYTSENVAFMWSFIRPPWAAGAMCCKRHVFNSIVKMFSVFEVRLHKWKFVIMGVQCSPQDIFKGWQNSLKYNHLFWRHVWHWPVLWIMSQSATLLH